VYHAREKQATGNPLSPRGLFLCHGHEEVDENVIWTQHFLPKHLTIHWGKAQEPESNGSGLFLSRWRYPHETPDMVPALESFIPNSLRAIEVIGILKR